MAKHVSGILRVGNREVTLEGLDAVLANERGIALIRYALVIALVCALPHFGSRPAFGACAIPSDVPGLVLWLDAINIDGSNNNTLHDGDAVCTWTNLAGSPNATSSGSACPTYKTNALISATAPSILFDGVDDYMTLGTALRDSVLNGSSGVKYTQIATVTSYGKQDQEILTVYDQYCVDSTHDLGVSCEWGTGRGIRLSLTNSAAPITDSTQLVPAMIRDAPDGSNGLRQFSTSSGDLTKQTVTLVAAFDQTLTLNSQQQLFVNSAQQVLTTGSNSGTSSASSNTEAALDIGRLRVQHVQTDSFYGYMSAILLFNRVITAAERICVQNYLISQYGTYAPSPDQLAPVARYSADSLLCQASGSAVSTWPDTSGHSQTLTQATSQNRPVVVGAGIGNQAAVTFDGLVTYLYGTSTSSLDSILTGRYNRTHTTFAVWKPSGASSQTLWSKYQATSAPSGRGPVLDADVLGGGAGLRILDRTQTLSGTELVAFEGATNVRGLAHVLTEEFTLNVLKLNQGYCLNDKTKLCFVASQFTDCAGGTCDSAHLNLADVRPSARLWINNVPETLSQPYSGYGDSRSAIVNTFRVGASLSGGLPIDVLQGQVAHLEFYPGVLPANDRAAIIARLRVKYGF